MKIADPETWVDQHGDYLYGYAILRMKDPTIAEDLVQETLLAVPWPPKTTNPRAK